MSGIIWGKETLNGNELPNSNDGDEYGRRESSSETIIRISTKSSYEENNRSGSLENSNDLNVNSNLSNCPKQRLTTKRSFIHRGSEAISMKSTPANPQVSEFNSLSENGTGYSDDNSVLKLVSELIDDHHQEDLKELKKDDVCIAEVNEDSNTSSFFGNVMTTFAFGNSKNDRDEYYSMDKFIEKYPYASYQKNKTFHDLFKSIDKGERLIDLFENIKTTMEFLGNKNLSYESDLYVSRNHFSINSKSSSILSINFSLSFNDVLHIKPKGNNSVTIQTINGDLCIKIKNVKRQDKQLTATDVHDLLVAVWSSRSELIKEFQNLEHLNRPMSPTLLLTNSASINTPRTRREISENNDELIQNAIRSVDDQSTNELDFVSNLRDSYSDDDNSSSENTCNKDSNTNFPNVEIIKYMLMPNSKYSYNGPYTHHSTNFPNTPLHKNEYILSETIVNAPPGIVYELMFSDKNNDFWIEFGKSQENSNFLGFDKYNDNKDENGNKYREYKYTKALHYPVGPKSTTCYTRDTISHLDYSNYIDILNCTSTPDVPSGGSFSTKTRYQFRWENENQCLLKISYWIDWTGSSWIKNMIDSSCKSGQISTNEQMIPFILEFVKKHTVTSTSSKPTEKISVSNNIKQEPPSLVLKSTQVDETPAKPELTNNQTVNNTNLTTVIILLSYIAILLTFQTYQNFIMQKTVFRVNDLLQTLTDNISIYN